MEVAPEQLDKFRALYREKFGIELTQKEALEKALPLLTLMQAIYRPMTEDDLTRVRERQQELLSRN